MSGGKGTGLEGRNDLERRILERKGGSRGDREKEDEGRVWSCRVVRGRGEGEGESRLRE
jgi:hypothetical protein